MHRNGSIDVRRLTSGTAIYCDSKLWVTALAVACAARWEGTASHSVDPGRVPTRMGGPGAPDDLAAGHQTRAWPATAADLTRPPAVTGTIGRRDRRTLRRGTRASRTASSTPWRATPVCRRPD